MEDTAIRQLVADLRPTLQDSFATNPRPILHHLNADSSWLLQIPRPRTSNGHSSGDKQRHWFNILIDPWLSGSQSDVARWFSQQWHAAESKVPSVSAVEELARQVELLSDELLSGTADVEPSGEGSTGSLIDVIAVCHEFTDHCHKETLLQCSKRVPVLATTKAAKLISTWAHFDTVLEIPVFPAQNGSKDWRSAAVPPLPEWVGIARLVTAGDSLYYHSALLFMFKSDGVEATEADEAETVIYTPHGVHAPDLNVITEAFPRLRTLAFMHGLHDVALPGRQLNLGAHNGLQAHRILHPKYWIGTHDEVKKAGGLIKWGLRRKIITVKDALEREKSATVNQLNGSNDSELGDVRFVDIGNGASTALT